VSETSPAEKDKPAEDTSAEDKVAEAKTADPKASTTKTTEAKADKEKTKPVKHRKAKPHGSGLAWLLVILLLAVIGVGAYLAWEYYQRTSATSATYLNRLQGLESALQANTQEGRQFSDRLDDFGQRQGHLEQGLNSYLEQNSHLRKDWLLSEAEYLIKLASHRLMLERDIDTAIVALNSADARLSEMGEPALIRVRKQLAKDLQALRSVPKLDLAGVSLSLTALAQGVDKLPLQTPDPEAIKQRLEGDGKTSREVSDWRELLQAIWADLKTLLVIRDHAQPIQPLMSPEQRFFLVQNLQLQLEQARLAALQGEKQVYAERLQQLQAWVRRYFDVQQAATQSVLQTLSELLNKDIEPDLPDISASFQAVEQYRRAQGAAKAATAKKPANGG